MTEEEGFDGRITQYRYNEAGELTEKIEGRGPDARHTYYRRDLMGRLSEKVSAGPGNKLAQAAQITRYEYDVLGQLTACANHDSRLSFEYDSLGQLKQECFYTAAGPRRLSHGYDALGYRTYTRLPDGRKINTLSYGSGHVHQINIDGQPICDFERDALHREISRTQGSLTSHYRLDPMGRLLEQHCEPAHPSVSVTPISRRYQYDAAGQLRAIEDPRKGLIQYRYDDIGRLIHSLRQGMTPEHFSFDPAHNLVPAGERLPSNRIELAGGWHYRYDQAGNLLEKKNAQQDSLCLSWDAEHQLIQATRTGARQKTLTHYRYDPLGRRVAKTVRTTGKAGSSVREIHFMWDGNRLLAEQEKESERLYLYAPNSFVPIARVDGVKVPLKRPASEAIDEDEAPDMAQSIASSKAQFNLAPALQMARLGAIHEKAHALEAQSNAPAYQVRTREVLYYHCDHLGTPQEITRADGALTWSVTYAAWGNVLRQEVSHTEQNLRFQGQYFDQETGLHYNRFRYYDPDIGRFVSQDPIGLAGGDNLYQYVPSPTGWSDPWGLMGKPQINRSPKDAQKAVLKDPGPRDITRIDKPEESVPGSQWHAHCSCGAAINQDGSMHDAAKAKGKSIKELFSKKTLEWLESFGWSIPK